MDSSQCCEFVHSAYNAMIPLTNQRVLAYNAYSGGLAVLDEKELDTYRRITSGRADQLDQKVVDDLIRFGFITRQGTDQFQILKREYDRKCSNPSSMCLSIAPTLACNFACDYCYQGLDKSSKYMQPDVIEAIVQYIEKSAPALNHLHVAWYGGEPLLQRRTIKKLAKRMIALCRANGISYGSMIATNGFLLSPRMAELLYLHKVESIQITLDGPPDVHDRRRILRSGKPSFYKIIENVKQVIDTNPIRINARINIDARNCEMEQMNRLFQVLTDNGLARKPNFNIYFAPVEAISCDCHDITQVTLEKTRYADLELALFKIACKMGLTGAPYPPRFRGKCAAIQPKGFVILPDGQMHKCWDTVSDRKKAVGSIFAPEKLRTDERHLKWLRWSPFEVEECKACSILPICTGACPLKFVHPNQLAGSASLPCLSWKHHINEMLLLYAMANGTIEPDSACLSSDQCRKPEGIAA